MFGAGDGILEPFFHSKYVFRSSKFSLPYLAILMALCKGVNTHFLFESLLILASSQNAFPMLRTVTNMKAKMIGAVFVPIQYVR